LEFSIIPYICSWHYIYLLKKNLSTVNVTSTEKDQNSLFFCIFQTIVTLGTIFKKEKNIYSDSAWNALLSYIILSRLALITRHAPKPKLLGLRFWFWQWFWFWGFGFGFDFQNLEKIQINRNELTKFFCKYYYHCLL
jgi:hypothetical protein